MLIRKHHFYQSYLNAAGAKDRKLRKTLLINEIANIIVARPDLAISNLVKSGIDVPNNLTEQQITEQYLTHLSKNKTLAKLTALEILAGNKISFDGKEYGVKVFKGADGEKASSGNWINSLIEGVGSIVGAASQKSKANKEQRKSNVEAQKNRLREVVASKSTQLKAESEKAAAKQQATGKNDNVKIILIVGGVLTVITILGVALNYGLKAKKA